jgi:hypothetical protein
LSGLFPGGAPDHSWHSTSESVKFVAKMFCYARILLKHRNQDKNIFNSFSMAYHWIGFSSKGKQ